MGKILSKIDYSKISKYLRGLVAFVKRYVILIEEEMDKGFIQGMDDEICRKKDCKEREND